MAKDGKDLVKEAVEDARALREAALSAAKKKLLEDLSPVVRDLMDRSIKGEGVNRMRRVSQGYPGEGQGNFEEAKEKGKDMATSKKSSKKSSGEHEEVPELDVEALASFFPNVTEEPDEAAGIPTLEEPGMQGMQPHGLGQEGQMGMGQMGMPPHSEEEGMDMEPEQEPEQHEAKSRKSSRRSEEDGAEEEEHNEMPTEAKSKKSSKEDIDEEVEISEMDLKKVYEQALQTEVQVKKGFGDMTPMGELEDVAKDAGKGLNQEKKGEHGWEEELPPAKQDFQVKESVRDLIRKGMAENVALRNENAQLREALDQAVDQLHGVNLFNAKVMHANRFLTKFPRLTKEQKTTVLERLDKAGSIDEVKMVYAAIEESLNIAAQSLSESTTRKPVTNAQRARSSGGADQEVLRESVDKTSGAAKQTARWQQLAGLIK